MKNKKRTLAFSAAVLFLTSVLTSCGKSLQQAGQSGWQPNNTELQVVSDLLSVDAVANLSADFILGMDASCVPALEASGVKYYDHSGAQRDVFEILRENGINYIRVRVWNDPFDAKGHGYGGGNCDIVNAIEIGKRATAVGMKLLVDFHYSDFWADPSKQMVPKAWQGMNTDEKSKALYDYTKQCLEKFLKAGVSVGMVQIGNETNGKLCGETRWEDICRLMSSGAKAVRQVCPDALVAVHFTNPEKVGSFASYGKKLEEYGVDYDVFASSYYPFWHGTLENLADVLSEIAETYGKKVMVAETSYAYTTENTDFHSNTIGKENSLSAYPYTEQGQADFVRDLINTVGNQTKNGIGVFYWEGTWISVGGKSYAENRALWETYGAGWASSWAGEYDPDDAGRWYGGCAVENQAFFDKNGKATEALKVFGLIQKENGGQK